VAFITEHIFIVRVAISEA